MRILIIDQCSKAKNEPDWFTPFDAEAIDGSSRSELLSEENTPALAARDLYAGRQQMYISQAVDSLRANNIDVTRLFVSAGFGVVDENTRLPPYNVTFSDYSAAEIDTRAEKLGIRDEVVQAIEGPDPYDIVFFALGTDYYRSVDISSVLATLPDETIAVLFNREAEAANHSNVLSLSARTDDAREFETIVVALKGVFLQNFASHISNGEIPAGVNGIEQFCRSEVTDQSGLSEFGT